MRIAVGLISVALLAVMLAEFFFVFLLPRRVKRDPRIARGLLLGLWVPWRAVAARLPRVAADTALGAFGPFGLLAILGLLSIGVICGYCGLQWAVASHLGIGHPAALSEDLYFSAGTFFSASAPSVPGGVLGKLLQVAEAATGFGFLAIAIGYLPALFQAFSRRETAVSRLDPRAGSPPSAAALLERTALRGGWHELDEYLREWESWTAELMETHLSYPILGYFRSQHVNQNWLAALTTIVDASAYAIAYGPHESIEAAELTFRLGRHALADLTYAFGSRGLQRDPSLARERLTNEALAELRRRLETSGLHVEDSDESAQRLARLRSGYEPYAIAISRQLALALPGWLPGAVQENWRAAADRGQHDRPAA
ncbi:MAG: two pore domain potassium channel family protein [Solirubrobacteraceae bacterium]